MTLWLVVVVASLACVSLKLAGYLVPRSVLERPTPSRVADLLTVALFAALTAVQALGAGTAVVIDARLPALAVAAGLFALRVPFVLVVILAAATAATIRALA